MAHMLVDYLRQPLQVSFFFRQSIIKWKQLKLDSSLHFMFNEILLFPGQANKAQIQGAHLQ